MIAITETDGPTETYEDTQRLIWQTVLRFNDRYGGDVEEQFSIANLAFAEAFAKYDPGRAQFTTLLVLQIRWQLWKALNKRINRMTARTAVIDRWPWRRGPLAVRPTDAEKRFDLGQVEARPDRSPFDVETFSEEASEDAKQVLSMALEFGPELKREVWGLNVTMGEVLRSTLRKLGWGMRRITESFAEIREALG